MSKEDDLATIRSETLPWEGARVMLQLVDESGNTFFEQTIVLKYWGRSIVSSRQQIFENTQRIFEWETLERRTSYGVIVHVLTPSTRAGDVARLLGYGHDEMDEMEYRNHPSRK